MSGVVSSTACGLGVSATDGGWISAWSSGHVVRPWVCSVGLLFVFASVLVPVASFPLVLMVVINFSVLVGWFGSC